MTKRTRKSRCAHEEYEEPFNALDDAELAAMERASLAAGAGYLRDWLAHLTDEERAEYADLMDELEAQANGKTPFGPPDYESGGETDQPGETGAKEQGDG